jgi:hypothetical protein
MRYQRNGGLRLLCWFLLFFPLPLLKVLHFGKFEHHVAPRFDISGKPLVNNNRGAYTSLLATSQAQPAFTQGKIQHLVHGVPSSEAHTRTILTDIATQPLHHVTVVVKIDHHRFAPQ